jgi:hypothetical protein
LSERIFRAGHSGSKLPTRRSALFSIKPLSQKPPSSGPRLWQEPRLRSSAGRAVIGDPVRPSEQSRGRTVSALKRGYTVGSLDTDTFSERVECALRTNSEGELRGLAADLPATWWRAALERGRAAVGLRRSASLLDPAQLASGRIVIGRSSGCDLVVADDTVSRRHAALELTEGAWRLRDLGSSNGTWVNGRRAADVEVWPGDELQLGAARFQL